MEKVLELFCVVINLKIKRFSQKYEREREKIFSYIYRF